VLDDAKGIDILGNIIEASDLTPNSTLVRNLSDNL